MGKTATCDKFYQLIGEIFQANGKLLANGDQLSAKHGLTGARWQVLGALQLEQRPLTVAQIARRMGLQRQSVQRLVDIMIKQGILNGLPNPEHKRAKLVELTQRGKAVCEQLMETKQCWAAEIIQDFSCEELERAIHVLKKLGERLD
ncbi:MarR family winged helix-turn-helix transcriptional regulator [Sedimenticola sp.]|uniref:MarR family winged helix-turn-helix transcriptional regulator n=1 Tax=Sedimenticola sp. TaxID=1940285 RepID=UPI003D12765B